MHWPSRSNAQIFYGKLEDSLTPKEHKMPYQTKKQWVAQESTGHARHGASAYAAIEARFLMVFCPSNPLRMLYLELTVN
jgi:hypothetical protein